MDAETVKKILVIDLAFIGDVILATPTMRALKALRVIPCGSCSLFDDVLIT